MGDMNIEEALSLHQRWGLSVIPIAPKAKTPLVEWEEYQHRKPSQEELIEWWNRFWTNGNQSNTGVVYGQVSANLAVPDFDTEVRWTDHLRWWAEDRTDNIYDVTPVVATGRGR